MENLCFLQQMQKKAVAVVLLLFLWQQICEIRYIISSV